MKELDIELWKMGFPKPNTTKRPRPSTRWPIFTLSNIAADHKLVMGPCRGRAAQRPRLPPLRSPKRASTARASTTTGRWPPTTAKTCWPGHAPRQRAVLDLPGRCSHRRGPPRRPNFAPAPPTPWQRPAVGRQRAPHAVDYLHILGDQLTVVLDNIAQKTESKGQQFLTIGADALPKLPRWTTRTDRNRTSPFAFTGNKVRVRMVPSSHVHRRRETRSSHGRGRVVGRDCSERLKTQDLDRSQRHRPRGRPKAQPGDLQQQRIFPKTGSPGRQTGRPTSSPPSKPWKALA